jgi:hypothetical protein
MGEGVRRGYPVVPVIETTRDRHVLGLVDRSLARVRACARARESRASCAPPAPRDPGPRVLRTARGGGGLPSVSISRVRTCAREKNSATCCENGLLGPTRLQGSWGRASYSVAPVTVTGTTLVTIAAAPYRARVYGRRWWGGAHVRAAFPPGPRPPGGEARFARERSFVLQRLEDVQPRGAAGREDRRQHARDNRRYHEHADRRPRDR